MVDLIQSHGGPTGQCFNLKKNLVTRGTQEGKTNFLSPLTNRKFDNVSTSPWLGITSNSECSYSSVSESDSMLDNSENEQENILPPTNVLKSGGASDKSKNTNFVHKNFSFCKEVFSSFHSFVYFVAKQ